MTLMFRFQSIILLLIDGIVANRLFLMADAAPSMQYCTKILVSADSNGDGRLSRNEYGDALRTFLRRDIISDVFDDASDDGVSQRLQLIFDDFRGPDDSLDIVGALSLDWTCRAIVKAFDEPIVTGRTSSSVVTQQDEEREISLEYCFVAMTINDSEGDGYLDSTEYLRFAKLLALEDLDCATKFEDLPQQLQDSFDARSSNELVSIVGAKPTDVASNEQVQFLTNWCIETISLVGEASGLCGVPTLAPNTELLPVASSVLECFYSYAQANENEDAWLSRLEYIIFVQRLSGNDTSLANLSFNELPYVLQNNFNDLAVDDAEIDISGSEAGSTPTTEELEYLTRVCYNTTTAIQLALSPGSTMPIPAPSAIPTIETSTPSIQPTSESPSRISLPTESPSFNTDGPTEHAEVETLEPTEAPSDTTPRPTITPSIMSFDPSGSSQAPPTSAPNIISLEPSGSTQAPTNASPQPTKLPSTISLKPSRLSATPSSSNTIPSLSPTGSTGVFEVRSTFVISNIVGISASDLSPVAEERLRLDASYSRLVQLVTNKEFGVEGSRRQARLLRRRLLVQYISQSAQTVNLTDVSCPLASANNTLCQTVEASFNINATSDENLVTVLADAKAAVDAGIQEGQLQSLLDELNTPLRIVVPSNSGNETMFTISASFVIANRMGFSAVAFSEGSKGYTDIRAAFGNLCSYVVQVNGTGAQYVANSYRILDVCDIKCPKSPAGVFCQSVFATSQVEIEATNPEYMANSITSAVEHEIEIGTLQTQLDFINPWSSYSIEEGYVPTCPETTQQPRQPAKPLTTFTRGDYIDEFGTTGPGRANNAQDNLDDDDGYYEEEYRYAPVQTRIPISPYKVEDQRFSQVFGPPKVSPTPLLGRSSTTPPTTTGSSAYASHGSEQAFRRGANSSSDSNASTPPASMPRVPMGALRAPIAEEEEDSESDDSSSGSSGSGSSGSGSSDSSDDDSDSSGSSSDGSDGSSSSSDDDDSDSGSESDED
ncbi:hypothetical protein MHU86_17274 [Fragilaria crotonensis]|nr:hypothetical protein MHU86_17274 [Fragilaria crotonensis]